MSQWFKSITEVKVKKFISQWCIPIIRIVVWAGALWKDCWDSCNVFEMLSSVNTIFIFETVIAATDEYLKMKSGQHFEFSRGVPFAVLVMVLTIVVFATTYWGCNYGICIVRDEICCRAFGALYLIVPLLVLSKIVSEFIFSNIDWFIKDDVVESKL